MAREGGPICISVINMKGGVGKTTVAALLCHHIGGRQWTSTSEPVEILAIDLDPQANLSQVLMGERSYRQFLLNRSPSIVEVFNGYQPPVSGTASASALNLGNVVRSTGIRNVQIIPSRFDFSDNLVGAFRTDERVLARLIANHFQDKDFIFIDCAPTESVLTRAAYHASRHILVPVRPEYLATIGFPLLSESLDAFRNSNRGHEIDVIGVVVNESYYDSRNKSRPEKRRAMKEIHEEAEENGWHIFENEIPFSLGFPKLMRGDRNRLGNADSGFNPFAREFFNQLGVRT